MTILVQRNVIDLSVVKGFAGSNACTHAVTQNQDEWLFPGKQGPLVFGRHLTLAFPVLERTMLHSWELSEKVTDRMHAKLVLLVLPSFFRSFHHDLIAAAAAAATYWIECVHQQHAL